MPAQGRLAVIVILTSALLPCLCEGQLITCDLTGTPVTLRAEGQTEPVGDILIQCHPNGQAPPGQSYLTADVQLFLNTYVVNRTGIGGNQNTIDAVLVINENNAPPTTASTPGGPAGNVPVPQYGALIGFSKIQWSGVQIPIPDATAPDGTTFPSRTTLRITNLRCNPANLGVSSGLVPTEVLVDSLAIADAAIVPGSSAIALSGLVQIGMLYNSSPALLAQCQSQNIVNGTVSGPPTFTVTIQEGLPNFFRPLGLPSTDGAPHTGEDGYPTPGIGANGGGADQGTRFLLQISNLGTGVRVAVPNTITQGTLTLQLTQADVYGNGAFTPYPGTGLIEMQYSGTTGYAVYEVIASDSYSFESIQIPVTVGYTANPTSFIPSLGASTLSVSFAPLTTVDLSNAVEPFPNFANYSVPLNAFSIDQCQGPAPSLSSISPNSASAGLTTALTIQVSGTNFLTGAAAEWNGVRLVSNVLSASALTASVPASFLSQPGAVQVDVVNPDGQHSNSISFTISGLSGPAINANGIVNAASAQPLVAPGSLASIFGTGLATAEASAPSLPLPTVLQGTTVSFNGTQAPLIYVSPTQINFQVPFEAPTSGHAQVIVSSVGTNSGAVNVALAEFAPGIFLSGNLPVVLHNGGGLVTLAKPAAPNEVLTMYGTGIGGLSNTPGTGAAAPSSPPSMATVTPTISVGGEKTDVLFAGLAPGLVGLAQFNFQMPANLSSDPTVPLVVDFNGALSPPMNLPIGKPTANLQITFSPNPVPQSNDGSWSYTVVLQETSGVGATLDQMVVGGNDYSSNIAAWFGSNRIEPNGQLQSSINSTCSSCTLPFGLVWSFKGDDDNGHMGLTWSGEVSLAPAQASQAKVLSSGVAVPSAIKPTTVHK